MKIAIFSPYLDTAGGGEKYMLSIAQVLSEGHEVDVLIDDHLNSIGIENIVDKNSKRHDLNLTKVNFKVAPMSKKNNFLDKAIFLKQYEYLIYNGDGSIFYSTAKNNIIHFQVPFETSPARTLIGRLKLKSWQKAIYNSNFTKDIIEKSWPIKGSVIYPPVFLNNFKSLKKKKQIISVGRFFGYLKPKKQDLMIKVFKEISKDLDGWSLHLAGGVEGDSEFVDELKKMAEGYNIYFYTDIKIEDLIKLYGESSIYWHAAGFGEDDPKKFEHFGITTVEAMAAGCVPVVINKGGQTEIVISGESGFLWDELEQFKNLTLMLAGDEKKFKEISSGAIKRSKEFGFENFKSKVLDLVK